MKKYRCIAILSIMVSITPTVQIQAQDKNDNLSFEQYIRNSVLEKSEIDVFVDPQQYSWAQYDAELGYILGNDLLPVNFTNEEQLRADIIVLRHAYAFAATEYILEKVRAFADLNDKQLLVVLFDPYKVTKSIIKDGTRYDQE